MNPLTKLALGAMGRLRPKPALGDAAPSITLPAPETSGGLPLMEAIEAPLAARIRAHRTAAAAAVEPAVGCQRRQPFGRRPHGAFGDACE